MGQRAPLLDNYTPNQEVSQIIQSGQPEAELPCDTFTKPFRVSADFLVRSASLRAGLRHKEKGFSLPLPSIYEPACAQNRAHADSTCWATLFRPLRGWLLVALDD